MTYVERILASAKPEELDRPVLSQDHASHVVCLALKGHTRLAADHLLHKEMAGYLEETVGNVIRQLNVVFSKALLEETSGKGLAICARVYDVLVNTALNLFGLEGKIVGFSDLEVGVCLAPSEADCPPVLVRPEDVVEKSAGTSNWSRKVYTCVGDNVKAKRLLVGETVNPPGNWSSAPPHKHDVKSAFETPLEEVYFFKIMPTQGFGLQRIYSGPEDREPFDEVYAVENNDAVVIPRGYHPVVAGPGYQLYYLWMLAGEERRYGAWTDDPRHSWLRDRESQISEVSHHL